MCWLGQIYVKLCFRKMCVYVNFEHKVLNTIPILEKLKIAASCRAGAMCPSAEYMGMQKLNIDQFVNPLEVQAARRKSGSKRHEKEGEAHCL